VAIGHDTFDRLLLSRSLIAQLRFKSANDRFAVAAHVLAAHDAAELAIAAVRSETAVPNISDTRALALPDHLGLLKAHRHPNKDIEGRDYISKLNRVRVDLKHHGITPDKDQWGTVAEKVFGFISSWCEEYMSVDYAGLDAADLIQSEIIRDMLLGARNHLQQDRFKECLEKLAVAIEQSSLELFPDGVYVSPGHANAEEALTVSAYGIDPGRFLALQRLLPCLVTGDFVGADAYWDQRRYGHEANWNRPNAEFAYEETVNLLTRLQGATPYPTPLLYEHVFRDIVVVKRDSPEVTQLQWGLDGWIALELEIPRFTAGDRIECRARGSMEIPIDPDECKGNPDVGTLVVALGARHPKLGNDDGRTTLIFKREDIGLEREYLYDESA
jgi:hypothetical protein